MSASKNSREVSNGNRRRRRGNQSPADWSSVSPDAIRRAIVAVAASGGAIRFGYTRDGGAYALGYLGDGEAYTEYLRPSDDVDSYLDEVAADWADGPPSLPS